MVYTVDMVFTVDMVYTIDIVYTVDMVHTVDTVDTVYTVDTAYNVQCTMQSVAGAATDDTSHVLLRGSRDSQHKPQSESFVISQPSLGFSPNQT